MDLNYLLLHLQNPHARGPAAPVQSRGRGGEALHWAPLDFPYDNPLWMGIAPILSETCAPKSKAAAYTLNSRVVSLLRKVAQRIIVGLSQSKYFVYISPL